MAKQNRRNQEPFRPSRAERFLTGGSALVRRWSPPTLQVVTGFFASAVLLRRVGSLVLLIGSGLLFGCASLPPVSSQTRVPKKKLIEFGWDYPNTAYLRRNIREMERRPFDGVVIRVTKSREPTAEPRDGGTQDTLGWLTFGKYRFQPRDYEHAIDDLKATKFQRFRDNFILMVSMPGLDWFDPEWDAVVHNAKVLPRVAKEGGCVGLVFDPEEYGAQKMWTYASLPESRRKELLREQYVQKVMERGAVFMRAINNEFPRVKILSLFGPSHPIKRNDYDLLPPFLEGMSRAAGPGTEIIDGYERSYGFKDRINFGRGREEMKVKARELFEDKTAFDRVMRVGFGLWLDYNSGRIGWHPGDFSKNFFSPEQFGQAVRHALNVSDRYVWIYSERPNWWLRPAELAPYEAAMRAARKSSGDRDARER